MELHVCPVRAFFTPEIEAWLDLFQQTHEVRHTPAGPRWERTSDIRRGFPALTVQALEHIKACWNAVLRSEQPQGGGGGV